MSDNYEDMDMDELVATRADLIDELAEVEAAISQLVADDAECEADDED
jgi:hypothetical protein